MAKGQANSSRRHRFRQWRHLRVEHLEVRAMLSATSGNGVEPVTLAGNPVCIPSGNPDQNPPIGGVFDFGFKLDNSPTTGEYTDGNITVNVTVTGGFVDWSSDLPVNAVIVKGGSSGNVYWYDPLSTGDTGLRTPLNEGGQVPNVSHIELCYNRILTVEKTADPRFDREYAWTLEKTSDTESLTLHVGESQDVNYTVTVPEPTYVDKNFGVDGTITINNPSQSDATVESVSDVIDGETEATVDCGVTFPYTLLSGESLVCTYSAELEDGSALQNVAAVITSGPVGGGQGNAEINWELADINMIDECVEVTDDKFGDLGQVCATDDFPAVFEYTLTIGPFAEPGNYVFENTAAIGDVTSTVEIPIEVKAALEGFSHGFWKTHQSEWVGYQPNDKLGDVFAGAYFGPYANTTLAQALDFAGGSGIDGALRILFRNAVASLLNAAHPNVNYYLDTAGVIEKVKVATNTQNRNTILQLESEFNLNNNLEGDLNS